MDWLCEAFGFRERLRDADEGGVVSHAELEVGPAGLIMIGHPGAGYRSPDRLGQTTAIVHVSVDDVDAHFRHAKAVGARIATCRPRNGAPQSPEPRIGLSCTHPSTRGSWWCASGW